MMYSLFGHSADGTGGLRLASDGMELKHRRKPVPSAIYGQTCPPRTPNAFAALAVLTCMTVTVTVTVTVVRSTGFTLSSIVLKQAKPQSKQGHAASFRKTYELLARQLRLRD